MPILVRNDKIQDKKPGITNDGVRAC